MMIFQTTSHTLFLIALLLSLTNGFGLDWRDKSALVSIISNVKGLPSQWKIEHVSSACLWDELRCYFDYEWHINEMSPRLFLQFSFFFLSILIDVPLTGSIGEQLGQFTELEYLKIVGAPQLEISLPLSLFENPELEYVELVDVHLTSPLPSFSKATSLENITIVRSGGFGPLPALPPSLEMLRLSENRFSGEIPPSYSSASFLEYIHLDNNELIGPLLDPLPNNIVGLYLGSNQLSGTIPSTYGYRTTLENLELEKNLLSGTIPASLFSSINLRYLNVSQNALSCPVQGVPSQDLNWFEICKKNGFFSRFCFSDVTLNIIECDSECVSNMTENPCKHTCGIFPTAAPSSRPPFPDVIPSGEVVFVEGNLFFPE